MPSPSDDVAAGLPARRDDEPESLRQDIVDELTDHLGCALQRELVRTPDNQLARRSVLQRFGDPAGVARRLWWDAMRERIMNQRITAISAGIAAAACLVACGLIWHMLEQTRRYQTALLEGQKEANALLAEQLSGMIAGQQQSNAELIAAISEGSGEDAAADDAAWLPLRIRLINDNGQPIQGSVSLLGNTTAGGRLGQSAETDETGVADFGLLPAGEYTAHYRMADLNAHSSTSLLLGPGRPGEFDVVCPSAPPGPFPIAFDMQPPDDLADVPLYYFVEVSYVGKWEFDGIEWRAINLSKPVLLVDTAGNVLGQIDYDEVTIREEMGLGYTTFYVEELAAGFPLQPFTGLPAYEFRIELWPLVADPDAPEPAGDGRPALKRLTGAALRGLPTEHPTAGEELRIRIDARHQSFWDDMRDDLVRMEPYRHLSVADSDGAAAPAPYRVND